MTVRAAIAAAMAADATVAALLSGGIYSGRQITPGMDAPHPFDANGLVKPSALVRMETAAADGPRGDFDRAFVVVFFYDAAGYGTIDAALDRTRQVLHGLYLGGGAYEVSHTDDVLEQYDDALLAFMHRSRYEAARFRG